MNNKELNKKIYTKNLFKWGDLLLVAILIISIALTIVYATKDDANMVEVYLDGELKYTFSLNENKEIQLLDGKVKVIVKDGLARISESDCKNQICVETKPIGKEGGVIVCLPNKVLVKVSNGGPNNIAK